MHANQDVSWKSRCMYAMFVHACSTGIQSRCMHGMFMHANQDEIECMQCSCMHAVHAYKSRCMHAIFVHACMQYMHTIKMHACNVCACKPRWMYAMFMHACMMHACSTWMQTWGCMHSYFGRRYKNVHTYSSGAKGTRLLEGLRVCYPRKIFECWNLCNAISCILRWVFKSLEVINKTKKKHK